MKRLTAEQKTQLQHVFDEAARVVSEKITKWSGQSFDVNFVDFDYIPLADIVKHAGGADILSVATLLPIRGKVEGYILFIFPELSARVFVDMVLRRPVGQAEGWGEVEQSVVKETGNILGSSFMNILAAEMDILIATSVPIFLMDYTGAIMDQLLLEYAMAGDEALLAITNFRKSTLDFEEYFFFIPSPDFPEILTAVKKKE